MDTKEKLSGITIGLHWVVALTIISLLAVGFYMSTFETYWLYPIHKSFGVIIFSIALLRILWRMKNGWPVPVRDYPRFEHILAKAIHWVLIIGTVAMPVSGMMMSGFGGHGFDVFGFVVVPNNHNPLVPNETIPYNAFLGDMGHEVHEIAGYLLAGAIGLHVIGALKHHIMDKDRTLLRMLGKNK